MRSTIGCGHYHGYKDCKRHDDKVICEDGKIETNGICPGWFGWSKSQPMDITCSCGTSNATVHEILGKNMFCYHPEGLFSAFQPNGSHTDQYQQPYWAPFLQTVLAGPKCSWGECDHNKNVHLTEHLCAIETSYRQCFNRMDWNNRMRSEYKPSDSVML